ncbi:Mbov_0729 family lipopotein [Metamycoplasma auris]|uniref:Variable surface lipoprotein n=1 Tax=Metamycoplasma auris TaxID=51363 RepID=A0A2W7GRY9_9BACT|nr:variable surface lipoprotein [Metamycoplasma auris]PZW00543.1 hypothetical protein BCF89_1032 [Metamycoplasma auris]
MKKLSKFISIVGAVASLSTIPIISAKCNVSDNNKPNKEDPNTKKDEDKNKPENNKNPKDGGDTSTPSKPSNTDNQNGENHNGNSEVAPTDPKKPSEIETPSKPEENEGENQGNNNANQGGSNNGNEQPKDSMPNDKPRSDSDSNISDEIKNKTPKEKIKFIYETFEKYKDLDKYLKDRNSASEFNNGLKPIDELFKYDSDTRDKFATFGLDHNFLGEFSDLVDLLSEIIQNESSLSTTKDKFKKLFEDIKSKVDDAYKKSKQN